MPVGAGSIKRAAKAAGAETPKAEEKKAPAKAVKKTTDKTPAVTGQKIYTIADELPIYLL